MYRIALCDDNPIYLEQIEQIISEFGEQNHLGMTLKSFSDSDLLMEYIEDKKLFDIYILDMDMPVHTGLDLAKEIRKVSRTACIVFLTSFANYAVEIGGLDIFRYVLKGSENSKIPELLDAAFRQMEQMSDDKIYIIQNERKFIKLYQRDILYVYKEKKYSVIALTAGAAEKERQPLQAVYQKMDNPCMYLLERGFILNMQRIREIGKGKIIMEDGHEIFTNRENLQNLKAALTAYWGELL